MLAYSTATTSPLFHAASIGIAANQKKLWIQKCRESQLAGKPIQFELPLSGPKTFFLCAVVDLGGNMFCWMLHDISDSKELEVQLIQNQEKLEKEVQSRTAQLQEALTIKSRFLTIISHGIVLSMRQCHFWCSSRCCCCPCHSPYYYYRDSNSIDWYHGQFGIVE